MNALRRVGGLLRKLLSAFGAFLKHPAVLLVITAALSSWAVPRIGSTLNRAAFIRQLSAKEATEVIDNSLEDSRDLNSMEVTLEFFYKNNRHPPFRSSAFYRHRQKLALAQMEQEYRQYDRHAWWWPRSVYWKASFLGYLPPDKLQRIQTLSNKYEKNLSDSNTVLNKLWTDLLRQPFNPRNPHLGKEVALTRAKMDKLLSERSALISQYVRIFGF